MKINIAIAICVYGYAACAGAGSPYSADVYEAMAHDKSRIIGEVRGAMAKEILRVVDSEEKPVMDAEIHGSFWPGANGEKYVLVDGITNIKGEYIAQGASKWRFRYRVTKSGHYSSNGDVDYLASTNVPVVKNGKWQPYGSTRTVVLKTIEKPQRLICWERTKDYKIPVYDTWLGFDFGRYQFVAPYGEGKDSDVLLRFTLKNPSRKDYHMRMEVSFTNMPYAGAYLMKKDDFSDFKNVYHADTNATYCQSFVYSFDRYPAKRPVSVELGEDEYLVFRTRTEVDENGRLVSANYGVLYGPWCFVGPRGMNIPFLLLNPTPNDTNLEDSEILNRVKRMGR